MSLANLSDAISNLQFDPMFNMGTGLMAASGPSLMPHSFGQDLAKGMQSSQQARLTAIQARMAQLQAQRYGLQNSAIAGVMGGGAMGGSQPPAGGDPSASGLMGPGATPGAPMLGSANGTPGTSYAQPGAAPNQPTPSGGQLAGGMAQDPMFKLGFAFDPSAASTQYLNRAYPQPTDFVKELQTAGIDPSSQIGRQLIQQNIAKQNYTAPTSLRGGGYMFDPKTGGLTNLPTSSPGFQVIRDPQTGQFQEVPVQGGVQAVGAAEAAKAGAQAGAKAALSPYSYTGPDGRTVNTTQLNYAGAVNGQGAQPSSDQVVSALAAKATQMVKEGIPDDVAQSWLQRQMQSANVGAQPATAQPAAGGVAGAISGPAPGFAAGQDTVAKSNASRYQDVVNAGQNAASRMNVYDNLRGLLNNGVQTGYGTQWQNHALSTIMNTPLLSSMIPDSAKKGAIDYQVAMKYIAQGTLQRFQGQKGTGTDSQLDAVAHGNTNPEQLAGAMKTVSRYLESQDMADLAKANAQQAWASQNGFDYSRQDRFENDWRLHNNPLVFQYKSADQTGRQELLKSLSSEQKVKLAHDMQYVSPFITTTPAAGN